MAALSVALVACGMPEAAPAGGGASKPGGAATPTAAPASATATQQAGSATPAAPLAGQGPVRLKVATQRLVSDVALYVAQERGYFAEQALEVVFEDITTGQGSVPPLAAGQIDVGVGAVSSGLFNAIARGIDIRLVATKGSVGPDPQSPFVGNQGLVLGTEVAASGAIQDYRDLRGRSIAISERGSGLEAMLDKAIQPSGVTTSELDFKPMPYPDMLVALANRSVDAAMELEPFITQGQARNVLVRWKTGAQLYPGQQAAAIAFGPTIARMGGAGERLLTAYTRAARDYNDALGPRRQGRDEIVASLIRNTALKDPALYDQMGWPYFNPDCHLNTEAMAWDLDWYHTHGYVPQKPDLAVAVDTSYCDYAVGQLGRYQP